MHIQSECAECQVPPLVLQPLIENAVKHGIASLIEGGTIRVTGEVRENLLRVRVENPDQGLRQGMPVTLHLAAAK